MLLYIIRHGDPIYETDSLTERGHLQAEALGKRLERARIDRVFTSPMGRARMTAEPTCRRLGLSYTVEDWAHEVEDERLTPYPDGKLKSISALPNVDLRKDGNLLLPYERTTECVGLRDSRIQEAVSYIESSGREFLERLGYREENGIYRILRPNEERVALFCHRVFTYVWLSSLLHIPLHLMWADFAPTHTGVTVLEFKNRKSGFTAPQCLCFSDMSHLLAEGLDMIHDNKVSL